jgi:DNA repair protein SbcD/Mre11
MRILLFSDLHLDTPFRWAPPAAARARRRALVETLHAIVDLAAELEVDALCSAGDLYEHDLISADTPGELRRAFARVHPIPVLLAPGNHDWFGPESIYARNDWSPNVHVFTSTRLERHPLDDGFEIWGGAHDRKRGTPGFLDDFEVDAVDSTCLALFHGSLRSGLHFEEEGKEPHAPFELEQVEAAGFSHALVGHFHTPAQTAWHTYPGNPDPLAFGETGERGAVLVEVAPTGVVARSVHTVARSQVADVSVDLTGCETRQEVRERVTEALASCQGTIRMFLEGEVGVTVDIDRRDLDGVAAHLDAPPVFVTTGVSWAYDLEAIASEATVRGEFVREVREAELDPELERRVLMTGLRALEGRSDLEVD